MFCSVKRKIPRVNKELVPYIILYSLAYLTYNVSYYMAGDFVPLDGVGSIFQLSAMLSGAICALWCQLGSNFSVEIFAILLCNAGSICILQPYPFFDTYSDNEMTNNLANTNTSAYDNTYLHNGSYHMVNANTTAFDSGIINSTDSLEAISVKPVGQHYYIGILLASLSGIVCSLQLIIQKKHLLDTDAMALYFWSSVIGTVATCLISVSSETPELPESWTEVLLLLGHGLANVLTISIFYAPYYTNVTVITTTLSMVTVFMYIYQETVLRSILPGPGNWIEILGIGLTMAGSMTMSLYTACASLDCSEKKKLNDQFNSQSKR